MRAEALFLLAGMDRLMPSRFPLKRISSPARTFVVMNAAAALSLAVFFVPADRLWRPSSVRIRQEVSTGAR